jgi:hypothetical protein
MVSTACIVRRRGAASAWWRGLRAANHGAGARARAVAIAPGHRTVHDDRVDAKRALHRLGEGGGIDDLRGIKDGDVGESLR